MKFLPLFIICFSLAYYFTDNTYPQSMPGREPSSEPAQETRNSYSKLPCPSEAAFLQWSKELNMDPIEGPSLDAGCKTKNYRVQMAQILNLAHQIKISFPKNWAPTVQPEINNSYEFLRQNTNQLRIDLTQTSSVARNYTAKKQIELGGLFFKEEPLEAISVLIHEARHSDKRDQGHTLCRIGDIPKTQGGCDNYFSNKAEDAGAYGYGTLYELALAQYSANLDKAEKELMITNAFTTLSTRFNTFNSVLAKHSDIITVLLEDGSLAWLHPYTFELIPLKIELPKFQEKIKKIEFSPRTNSLMLFTESSRLLVWGPRHKAKRPVSDAITEDDRFIHMSRQYVPYFADRTLYTTLKTNGQLEFIQYDAEQNKYVILPYPLHSGTHEANPTIPNLKYFLLGSGFNSYFLDKQGLLTRAHRYANEMNFILDPEVQSNSGGWKTATGGAYYEQMVLTDADGKLTEIKVSYDESSGDAEAEIYKKEPYGFQTEKPTKKYLQGLQFHAALDEDGGLSIASSRIKGSNQFYKNTSKKIVDFVITRLTLPESNLYRPSDFNDSLLRKCNIKKTVSAVGYGSVMGLNQDSRLVAASSDGRCTVLLKEKLWTQAEMAGIDDSGADGQERHPFPDVYLKLTNQSDKFNWAPYTRSSFDQSK